MTTRPCVPPTPLFPLKLGTSAASSRGTNAVAPPSNRAHQPISNKTNEFFLVVTLSRAAPCGPKILESLLNSCKDSKRPGSDRFRRQDQAKTKGAKEAEHGNLAPADERCCSTLKLLCERAVHSQTYTTFWPGGSKVATWVRRGLLGERPKRSSEVCLDLSWTKVPSKPPRWAEGEREKEAMRAKGRQWGSS